MKITEILLSLMNSDSSLVKPDSDEISKILLSLRDRSSRLVKDSDEFEMLLLSRTTHFRSSLIVARYSRYCCGQELPSQA